MRRSFAVLACVLFVGCGSSGSEGATVAADTGAAGDATGDGAKTDTGAKTDATTDTGTPVDAAGDTAGVKCGDAVCGSGQVCCAATDSGGTVTLACATSCPDGGGLIACDGPEDCAAGAPICCAEVNVTGTAPACTFKSGVTECRAKCDSNIPLTCPSKATARPCHKAADCPESGYANCCEFENGGTTATFCADDTMKLVAVGCF